MAFLVIVLSIYHSSLAAPLKDAVSTKPLNPIFLELITDPQMNLSRATSELNSPSFSNQSYQSFLEDLLLWNETPVSQAQNLDLCRSPKEMLCPKQDVFRSRLKDTFFKMSNSKFYEGLVSETFNPDELMQSLLIERIKVKEAFKDFIEKRQKEKKIKEEVFFGGKFAKLNPVPVLSIEKKIEETEEEEKIDSIADYTQYLKNIDRALWQVNELQQEETPPASVIFNTVIENTISFLEDSAPESKANEWKEKLLKLKLVRDWEELRIHNNWSNKTGKESLLNEFLTNCSLDRYSSDPFRPTTFVSLKYQRVVICPGILLVARHPKLPYLYYSLIDAIAQVMTTSDPSLLTPYESCVLSGHPKKRELQKEALKAELFSRILDDLGESDESSVRFIAEALQDKCNTAGDSLQEMLEPYVRTTWVQKTFCAQPERAACHPY